jgi:hypothetical protein
VDIIDYDGHEWMRGHGFPGWAKAWMGTALALMFGVGSAAGSWHYAHGHRDWSDVVAIGASLFALASAAVFGLFASVVALFAISGLREWSTVYFIRTDAGTIIVEFQRFGGLVHDRRELPTASVSEVTTKMAGAWGDTVFTDISVRLESGPLKVFRSANPTEVEMLVIYLNAACGRHAGAGTAAQISAQWAAMKATIDARNGTVAAGPPPPSAAPPAP